LIGGVPVEEFRLRGTGDEVVREPGV